MRYEIRPLNATRKIGPWMRIAFSLLALMFPLVAVSGQSLFDSHWHAGFRYGFSEGGDVRQGEFAADHRLPWAWQLGNGWMLATELQAAIGGIGDDVHIATIASFGPSLRLSVDQIPVSLVGGCSPTVIGRNRMGGEDLGTAFQFTSHIGLSWHITEHLQAGYRFQHMSNAGLSTHNPGVNLHMVGVSWRF